MLHEKEFQIILAHPARSVNFSAAEQSLSVDFSVKNSDEKTGIGIDTVEIMGYNTFNSIYY